MRRFLVFNAKITKVLRKGAKFFSQILVDFADWQVFISGLVPMSKIPLRYLFYHHLFGVGFLADETDPDQVNSFFKLVQFKVHRIGIGLEFLVKYNFTGYIQDLNRLNAFGGSNCQMAVRDRVGIKFNFPNQLILPGLKINAVDGIQFSSGRQTVGSHHGSPNEKNGK